MPTLMTTETETTTYYNDGSAKRKTSYNSEEVKNSQAFDSEEETTTIYDGDESNDEVEIIMLEADTEFLEQEIDELEAS